MFKTVRKRIEKAEEHVFNTSSPIIPYDFSLLTETEVDEIRQMLNQMAIYDDKGRHTSQWDQTSLSDEEYERFELLLEKAGVE